MCLAQGHNSMMPVRLEPATPLSRVKHSTTEPLHSLMQYSKHFLVNRVDFDQPASEEAG